MKKIRNGQGVSHYSNLKLLIGQLLLNSFTNISNIFALIFY
jgi:hypothetical protein